jgi:hypothetical protein
VAESRFRSCRFFLVVTFTWAFASNGLQTSLSARVVLFKRRKIANQSADERFRKKNSTRARFSAREALNMAVSFRALEFMKPVGI